MFKLFKYTFLIFGFVFAAVFLQYTLPQHDIVRVVGTENRRIDFGENSMFWASADAGTDQTARNRDVFFIQTKRADGSTMVYRNEDTSWNWPPYFKFDSSNLQAEAAGAISSADNPKWYSITHYGWRIKWLTIFPNAVSIAPVDGPDATIIPWVTITILTSLLVMGLTIRVMVLRLYRRLIKPSVDDTLAAARESFGEVEATGAAVSGEARKRWRWVSAWLGTWKGKPRV